MGRRYAGRPGEAAHSRAAAGAIEHENMVRAALIIALLFFPDFDRDGDIDQSDYGLLQTQLGTVAVPWCEYDLNVDGVVDTLDVEIFGEWWRIPK